MVGSRPDGWWRDRTGAAARLCDRIGAAVAAGRLEAPVLVVLEGRARQGVPAGPQGSGVTIVHAAADADSEIVRHAGPGTTVVTADRALRGRVSAAGARVAGPGWLRDLLVAGRPVVPEEGIE